MRIEEALTQVRAIQGQVVRTEQFCCYRWATVTCSSLLAVAAACVQSRLVFDAAQDPDAFLACWIAVAGCSHVGCGPIPNMRDDKRSWRCNSSRRAWSLVRC